MSIVIGTGSGSYSSAVTALDIIKRAMRIMGAIGQNETPTTSEANDGLTALNEMIDSWNTDRTFIYSVVESIAQAVSGQATYTVATGGNFDVTRPVKIDSAFIRLNSVDYPLQQINSQDYNSIPFKGNESFPHYFYYDAAFPTGNITFYGTPTVGEFHIFTYQQISVFPNLTSSTVMPQGYLRALAYGLAQDLSTEYGISLSPEAMKTGTEALANIRAINIPDLTMKTEAGYLVGRGPYQYGPWSY